MKWSWIDEEIEGLRKLSRYRALKRIEPGAAGKLTCNDKELINLCGNDYLGISGELNPDSLLEKSCRAVGATSARLIAGNHPSFSELEETVAQLKGTEGALVFSCGYMANTGAISALAGPGDAIYSDRLNHASIVDGIRLSGARHIRYRHGDVDHLESLLQKDQSFRRKLVISESIFSMDGDIAPLRDIVAIKDRYGAMLMIDEAHSGGLYGRRGAGLVNELGVTNNVDIIMGTFSKAYGCYGAYIAGDNALIEWLINKARSFIFTTGLPPIINQLNMKSLKLVGMADDRRKILKENGTFFRNELRSMGLDTGTSETQIIPLIVGSDHGAVDLSNRLWHEGIACAAIRPPTVPANLSRLRFSITSAHHRSDLEYALSTIARCAQSIMT